MYNGSAFDYHHALAVVLDSIYPISVEENDFIFAV